MVLRRNQQEVDVAYKAFSKRVGMTTGKAASTSSGNGYEAGQAAGNSVQLGGGRALGAAPGRLRGTGA